MSATHQSVPSPSVTASARHSSRSQAWKKPKRPSSAVGAPVRPRATSWAAFTPDWAARPQWMRLTVPPVRLASMIPDAMEQATAMALAARSASPGDTRTDAVAAAPMAPQIDVACWPCSKYADWPPPAAVSS